jgi:hypothetical protein
VKATVNFNLTLNSLHSDLQHNIITNILHNKPLISKLSVGRKTFRSKRAVDFFISLRLVDFHW